MGGSARLCRQMSGVGEEPIEVTARNGELGLPAEATTGDARVEVDELGVRCRFVGKGEREVGGHRENRRFSLRTQKTGLILGRGLTRMEPMDADNCLN